MTQDHQTTTDQVVKTILTGIKKGTFTSGQRLPSQREMASMFGVSRMVIREAVKILEGKGILFSKRGSGIYVKQEVDNIENTSLGSISSYEIEDIYSLSSVIWKSCTDLVVENATDSELQELYKRTTEMYESYGTSTSIQVKYIYETAFGLTICKLTHNKLLYKLMVEMLNITSDIDYQVIKSNGNYKKMIEMDLRLIESLMSRDSNRARFWSNEREIEIHQIIKSNNLDSNF